MGMRFLRTGSLHSPSMNSCRLGIEIAISAELLFRVVEKVVGLEMSSTWIDQYKYEIFGIFGPYWIFLLQFFL